MARAGPGVHYTSAVRPVTLLSLACAVLAVEVVVLAVQNRRLEARVREVAASASGEAPLARDEALRFAPGDALPLLELVAADGEHETLPLDAQLGPGLLLVYAGGCRACDDALPVWEREGAEAIRRGWRVIGLRLDRAPEAGAHVPFPVYHLAEPPRPELARVPITLIFEGDGTIRWLHYGTLGETGRTELERHVRG